jgi:hypothetical protein
MDTVESELESKEGPRVGGPDTEMCFLEGTGNRELQGTRAAGHDPVSVSLESLAEKVNTLGFRKPLTTLQSCQQAGEEGKAGGTSRWGTCRR